MSDQPVGGVATGTIGVGGRDRAEVWAVVVAAGSGSRFGGRKQFAVLAGRTVLEWSLAAAHAACTGVVLVVPAEQVPTCVGMATAVVPGGATRAQSVRAGLAAVPTSADVIVVHDAARPLSSPGTWAAVVDAVLAGADGAIPCVPVADTIKQLDHQGRLVTLDRSRLLAAQTPQAFRASSLRRAHAGGTEATDDAGLVEGCGGRVVSVPGDARNLKITDRLDLSVAERLLTSSEAR